MTSSHYWNQLKNYGHTANNSPVLPLLNLNDQAIVASSKAYQKIQTPFAGLSAFNGNSHLVPPKYVTSRWVFSSCFLSLLHFFMFCQSEHFFKTQNLNHGKWEINFIHSFMFPLDTQSSPMLCSFSCVVLVGLPVIERGKEEIRGASLCVCLVTSVKPPTYLEIHQEPHFNTCDDDCSWSWSWIYLSLLMLHSMILWYHNSHISWSLHSIWTLLPPLPGMI